MNDSLLEFNKLYLYIAILEASPNFGPVMYKRTAAHICKNKSSMELDITITIVSF